MAVTPTEKETQVIINVEISNNKFKNITLQYVNPLINDNTAYEISTALAGLQTHTVNKIRRRNLYTMIE